MTQQQLTQINSCTLCNVCKKAGTFMEAVDKRTVPSVARQFFHESFTVWRCAGCGSLHSKEAVDLDRYYQAYAVKDHVLNFATRLAYKNRLRLLKKFGLQKHHQILDFGCGSGMFVRFLKENGYTKTSGYDAFVKEYADESVLQSAYDYVVTYDVIEHDDDPHPFMKRLAARVKSGGYLILGTPNASAIKLERLDLYFMSLHQPYHRHILSEEVLIEMAQQENFNFLHLHRRSDWDTLIPFHNARFYWSYCAEMGSVDAVIEAPNLKRIFSNPRLLANAFLGYFFPTRESVTGIFRKK